MTIEELVEMIRHYIEKHPEGIFDCGEFDLDVNIDARDGSLSLWLDSDTKLDFPKGVSGDEIQKAVRSLGRELLHTWGQQYSEYPTHEP